MFTESAELYDAIYFTFKDYASEAAMVAAKIRAALPAARTVLDVACGTGEHARLLGERHGFDVDGIDLNPDFVRLAQAKSPGRRFWIADMTDFDVAHRYDAVVCMFSSIGYVRTLPRLERTLRCFTRHLMDGGVIIVEPWFPPGTLTDGWRSVQRAETADATVERVSTTELDGRLSRLRFDYEIRDADGVRHASELHELGLFTEQETLAAFEAAGLDAVHEPPSEMHRGLYIARARASPGQPAIPRNQTPGPGSP